MHRSLYSIFARENAVKEHAQALAYKESGYGRGCSGTCFDEEDLPYLRSIYPEITDYLEESCQIRSGCQI